MSFTKSDFDNLDERVKKICSTEVETIVSNNNIPSTNNLEDNNKVYEANAAILFVDIRKSTLLTDLSKPQSMVKIYRSFMRMGVDCVRKNNGVTRQFLGDRIMGIFVDTVDGEGNVINNGAENALNCARSMLTCLDFSLNKQFKNNVNGKEIECGIGIDLGKILVTKVGMYGLEDDEEKNNETDCVYVGKVTNYASKYADIAKGGEILISENVYKKINEDSKEKFKKSINIIKGKSYQCYSVFNYYLDFSQELGNPYKPDLSIDEGSENDSELVKLVDKLDSKYQELLEKEKKLAVQEEKLKEATTLLKEKYNELRKLFYDFLFDSFVNRINTKELGYEFWKKCIDSYYFICQKLDMPKEEIDLSVDCYLINIYNLFGLYDEAFRLMIIMVKASSWVCLKKETINWAYHHNKLFDLKYELNRKIEHCENSSEWEKCRKELEKYEKECRN